MATGINTVTKGSKIAIIITLSGLPAGIDFTDEDVDFTLHFYVSGKRSTAEVDIKKSEVKVSTESTNIFYAILDTSTLPTGNVMCEGDISYPYSLADGTVEDKPCFDCEVKITDDNI